MFNLPHHVWSYFGMPVCPLGEDAVELSHRARQVGLECFDKQVIVVGHQAPCMDAPVEAYTHGAENIDEGVPVGVIETDSVATISPRHDVVEGPGRLDS